MVSRYLRTSSGETPVFLARSLSIPLKFQACQSEQFLLFSQGTTNTLSASPATISPGCTATPPHEMGISISPHPALAPNATYTPRQNTGKRNALTVAYVTNGPVEYQTGKPQRHGRTGHEIAHDPPASPFTSTMRTRPDSACRKAWNTTLLSPAEACTVMTRPHKRFSSLSGLQIEPIYFSERIRNTYRLAIAPDYSTIFSLQ